MGSFRFSSPVEHMKFCLLLIATLLFAAVYADEQISTCGDVDCAPGAACTAAQDCPYFDREQDLACCAQCCPSTCVNCLLDPCANYYCESDPSLVCHSDYCGGCNRLWYSDKLFGYVKCSQEATGNAAQEDDDFTTVDDVDPVTSDLFTDLDSSSDSLDDQDGDNKDSKSTSSSKSRTSSATPLTLPLVLIVLFQILF